MKPQLFTAPIVVMSVTTDGNLLDEGAQLDKQNLLMARLRSRGYVVEAVIGYYQGQREYSVMVMLPNELDHIVRCVEIARDDFGQQCILLIDPEGKGFLIGKECCMDFVGNYTVSSVNSQIDESLRPSNRTELADGRFFYFTR
ncbi:hypothetical protein ST21_018 [Aeromonas phage ST21]|uniref:Uncharacterized protein n=1 Tax=Aeromonas phage ST21 TaxID=3065691 RepID=A0AA96ESP4_9CAUD|nr:hypothetical protein ST21_018 [Aeromonas phage ST21]